MSLDEKIKVKIQEVSKNGKISCTAAHKVAKELEVPVRKVGKLINELNLKIIACELGCF
jgi:putative methionine-R-sulfoxide reductase with GAF domain